MTRCFQIRRLLAIFGLIASCAGIANAAPLTLDDAIDRAIVHAPAVDGAKSSVELTDARVREQRAPMMPSIATGAEYSQSPGYDQVITNRGLSTGLVTMNYTAWDWGRRDARLSAARQVAQAARNGVDSARTQIAFEASLAFFDLIRANVEAREASDVLARMSGYVAVIDELKTSGRATAADAVKIRTLRDTAELALAGRQSAQATARASLNSLIGSPMEFAIDLAEVPARIEKPKPDFSDSPAMLAAQRAISSANLQVKATTTERLPTLQLAFSTGFLGVDPRPTISHNFGGSYDTVLSMPVFDGGATSSRIDQARAREHSAQAQARQIQYTLSRRIEQSSQRFDQGGRALEILTRSQPNADDSFALAWTRFLGDGNVTLLDVLDSFQRAEDLRFARFENEFAMRASAAEINLLCGRIR
jgi:outer membrane protein TolC